jgi:hypothetical protein
MSKNVTQKGLAFGAGLSLIASGFAGLPASALELDEGIPMKPTSGPEAAYAIYAKDGATFSLTASPVSTAMAGDGTVKFKVGDAAAKFLPTASSSAGYSVTIAADTALVTESTVTDQVVLTISGVPDGTYLVHTSADVGIDNDGDDGADDYDALKADTLVMGEVVGNKLIINSADDVIAEAGAGAEVNTEATLTLVGGAPSKVTQTNFTITNATVTVDGANAEIDIDTTLAAGTYAVYPQTTVVVNDDGVDDENLLAADSVQFITLNSNGQGSLKGAGSDAADDTLKSDVVLTFVTAIAGARAADNSFVVDSRVGATSTNAVVELEAIDAVDRSVTVQAFVDDFANDAINAASEYTSAVQTVRFASRDNVSWTTSLTAPAVGDQSLAATMTSSPVINGAENDDDSNFQIAFTRQDSSSRIISQATQIAATGTWRASVTMETGTANLRTVDADGNQSAAANQSWADLTRPGSSVAILLTASGIADEVVTIDTNGAAHNLRVGDLVTIAGFTDGAETETNSGNDDLLNDEHEVTAILSADQFQFALEGAKDDAAFAAGDGADYDTTTYAANPTNGGIVDRVFAGDYSARAFIEDLDGDDFFGNGNTSTVGTLAAKAADTVITTVASATLQGASVNNSTDSNTDAKVAQGTLSATVTATVVDKDGASVGAGRAVSYVLTRSVPTIRVNGSTANQTLITDVNGQVTFNVTDTAGIDGTTLTIAVTPEGVSGAQTNFTLEWDKAAITMVDLNTTANEIGSNTGDRTETRLVADGTSYVVDILVADQWYTPADSATYRVKVTGSGVTEGIQTLTAGKTSVTITDGAFSDSFNTVLTLEKLTAGTWRKVVAKTITTTTATDADILFATDGSAVYEATAADLSDAVAKVALVERDPRSAFAAKPAYDNAVTVTGKVIKKTSSASLGGSVVTISGPSNVLFEHGTLDVAKRGSITFLAESDGEFAVVLYSTTAQKDTVITVTANGVSKTVKVTFTGIGVGEGTSLVVTAPAAVQPASTFQVKAKLSDAFGNGVAAAAGRVKVTYTGPGIVFGTLPTSTDANGELMFSVLLGANDKGSISVTVSYDQNGDGDYVDAKDLNTSVTIAIGTAAAATAGKVNVGSFNGKLVVYALGLDGAKISWKVAGKWGTAVADGDALNRFDRPVGASGVNVIVEIYVNGAKQLTKTVLTK